MRRLLLGGLAGALVPLAACSSGPKPDPTAAAYLSAWQQGDAAAGRLTDAPQPATAALAAARRALAVTKVVTRLGPVRGSGDTATAAYTATLTLRGLGDWTYAGSLALRKTGGRWRVHWVPADLYPTLQAGQRLGRTRSLPARAPILDGHGRPLVTPTEVVTVSVLPSALRHRGATLDRLAAAVGVDRAGLGRAVAAAPADQLLPVITLRRPAYDKVRGQIHDLPGVRFPTSTQLLPPTPTFARAVLGRVGLATVDALRAAGAPYQAGDEVGLNGLQAAYQRRLAGTPSGSVVIEDAAGKTLSTVHAFAGAPGQRVRTTLDPRVQAAAERTLAHVPKPAALVAVRPSDGAILAAANAPGDSSFDRALVGHYPPGSTFKIVTTAALVEGGLGLDDPVRCPPTRTVEGKTFSNFEGEAAGAVPFRRDFAISCNTAFVGLSSRLPDAALPATARRLGIGAPWTLPITSFSGSVPPPASPVERAADAIGQGRVSVSPLGMALVAAAVQAGRWQPPVLVTDPAQRPGPAPVPMAEAAPLRTLMRSVVTQGTAAAAFRGYRGPAVSGKTGTAEFGTGNPPQTHAWFVGFRGDFAFAVLVEGGGVGGAVAAPLAAAFLRTLGPELL